MCQKFFLATVNIDKRITTALRKATTTGCVESDLRGKQGKHNAVEEDREKNVIEHIQQFLTAESHYVRKDVKYLARRADC